MENQETKRIISLKDIPPLDPSSIPFYSSLKPRTMMAKQRHEEKSTLSFSNILIDPNSTRSVSITQENMLVPETQPDYSKPKSNEESKKRSAKSVLHEICACKRWRPPVYDCCKVEGPCHLRLFTYKVLVETSESSGKTVLECFGDPKRNKKAAAEHAAEGALWYLEHVGETRQSCISKSSPGQMK